MTFGEALNIVKVDSAKRITDGKDILGYAPRFNQFYMVEDEHTGYCVFYRGEWTEEQLLMGGWEVVI